MDSALAQLIYAMPVIKMFHLRHTNGLACFVAWCLSQGKGVGGLEIPWQQFCVPEASVKGWVSSAHHCILTELDLRCATLFVPIVKEDLPSLRLR